MKIGVFDSGRGGELIAEGLRALLPHHEFIVINDHAHVPYGSRTSLEVQALVEAALQPLFNRGCPIIVIACNTATVTAINVLRKRHPATKFVGIEPMIKPATLQSKNRRITVLATPLTLASTRYKQLVAHFGAHTIIDQPDTSEWAARIERHAEDEIMVDELVKSVAAGSDTIVLACTHYISLKTHLQTQLPDVEILEPTEAIAHQIERLAAELV